MQIAYRTPDASYIKVGESATASVFLQPGNFDITRYATISADDENILTTDNAVGLLWPVSTGETTVRATYEDMEVSSQVKVICEEGELEELSLTRQRYIWKKNRRIYPFIIETGRVCEQQRDKMGKYRRKCSNLESCFWTSCEKAGKSNCLCGTSGKTGRM